MGFQLTNAQRITFFLGVSMVASWGLVWSLQAVGATAEQNFFRPLSLLYWLPPAVVSIVAYAVTKTPFMKPLGFRISINRWFVFALLMPPLMLALAALVTPLFPGVDITWTAAQWIELNEAFVPADSLETFRSEIASQSIHPAIRSVLQGMTVGMTVGLLFSVWQELGFRGLLYDQIGGSFWRRALLTGLAWAMFSLPVELLGQHYPDAPLRGILVFVPWCLVVGCILTFLRAKTGSIVASGIFMSTTMAMTRVGMSVTIGGEDIFRGIYGLPGLVGATVLLGLLVLIDRFGSGDSVMASNPAVE